MPRRPKPPPPTLVFFVRHGQTPSTGQVLPGRAPGLHLADRGREQAEAVAERLATVPSIAAIYASPLERTRETAAAIASRLGTTVKRDRALLDCDSGQWTGEELKRLRKTPEWSAVQHYPSGFRFPEGESLVEMQVRMLGAVERLCRRHPGAAIVLVSHADPIKAVAAHALGVHLDLFQRIVISPCSVTAIAYGATGAVVLTLNSTDSLADLKAS